MMSKTIYICFRVIAIVIVLALHWCIQGNNVFPSPSEMTALQDFYTATGGVHWTYTTQPGIPWTFNESSSNANPCGPNAWYGIYCFTNSTVSYIEELYLSSSNLTGTLPSSIGNLTHLNELDLSDNFLHGALPESLVSLVQLEYFSMESNLFSGSIPSAVSKWSKLEYLILSYNFLTGTIPSSLGELRSIVQISMSHNRISGSIPASLGNLYNISIFAAYENKLNGSLPESLSHWSKIKDFYVYTNELTGSLPAWFGNWTQVEILQVCSNKLTGTISPTLGNMRNVQILSLWVNYLEGSLPESLCDLKDMYGFGAYQNAMTGSIPGCLGNWSQIQTFLMLTNFLTGTIPTEMGLWSKLSVISCEGNYLTSTLPSSLGDCSLVATLAFNGNYLTKSIPESFAQLSLLYELYLDKNLLSGSIPSGFSQLGKLSDLVLHNNVLSGSLEFIFNHTAQYSLSSVNINQNSLTGSVPDEVYLLPQLLTLGLGSNCLSASLSSIVCSSPKLTGLVLDGIGTASACRTYLFPHIPNSLSYLETGGLRISGSIPSCLFTMSTMQTLHLSGNAITGTIPNIDTITSSLVDLDLSHNSLSGTLPASLQTHPWQSFDLSFNRLSGELDNSFNPTTTSKVNYSVSLQVNRLSGVIPTALTNAENIHLVDGNMLTCGIVDRSALPAADPATGNYQCGSNAFDLSLYLFLAVCSVAILLWIRVQKVDRTLFPLMGCTTGELPNIESFLKDLSVTVKSFAIVAGIILLVFLPVYSALNSMYSVYTVKYAWIVSAAYISGVTPGAVLLCVFTLFVAGLVGAASWLPSSADSQGKIVVCQSTLLANVGLISFLNLVSVVGINILYVYVLLHSQSQGLNFVVTTFTALFKIFWNSVCMPFLFKKITVNVVHRIRLVLFNLLIVPFAVLAAISPNCFYYVFANSEPVSATINFVDCGANSPNGTCVSYSYFPITSSYTPPFVYNYQCTSTFISDYSSVYVYMCLISGLISPFLFTVMRQFFSLHPNKLMTSLMPKLWRPPCPQDKEGQSIVNRDLVVVRVVTSMFLLLTFGVMVPLLSIVIVVDQFSFVYFTHLNLQKLLTQTNESLKNVYRDKLEQDCGALLASFQSTLQLVLTFVVVFYGVVLWDIVGDEVGLVDALWAPLVVVFVPLAVHFALKCRQPKSDPRELEHHTEMTSSNRNEKEDVSNPIYSIS